MKRYVRSAEILESYSGFYFVAGNRGIFLKSNMSNITDRIVRQFINAVCDMRGVGDKIRESALYSEATLKDFKRRIDRAELIHNDTGKITYWTIKGNNFQDNFPEEDFERDIIVIGE